MAFPVRPADFEFLQFGLEFCTGLHRLFVQAKCVGSEKKHRGPRDVLGARHQKVCMVNSLVIGETIRVWAVKDEDGEVYSFMNRAGARTKLRELKRERSPLVKSSKSPSNG